jgi:hypothetical protein
MAGERREPNRAEESSWVRRYFDAIIFFYLEPQHLGRIKNPKAIVQNEKQALKRLEKIEVTLNHSLNQFFSIAPISYRREFFETVFRKPFDLDLFFHGFGVETTYGLPDSVQADFLFTSSNAVASIEMKIDAKTSSDQVLKYCLLGLAHERDTGIEKKHFLMLLAPVSSRSLWKEGYASVSAAKDAIAQHDLDAFIRKHPSWVSECLPRLRQIVEGIELQQISYRDLSKIFNEKQPSPADTSPGAEVLRRLIGGFLRELRDRGLT